MIQRYQISQQVGFFDELNTLVTATAAVAIAADLHVSGSVTYQPGDYLTIVGKHVDSRVRMPLAGPIAVALAGRKPDVIELAVVPGRDRERGYAYKTSGLVALLDSLFQPFIVNYYERWVDDIRSRVSTDRTSWPASWQMGWMIRNAVSHGGNVHFRHQSQQPVSWRGLTVSPADQGKQVLGHFINQGDLLVLLIDMEESRAGPLPLKSS